MARQNAKFKRQHSGAPAMILIGLLEYAGLRGSVLCDWLSSKISKCNRRFPEVGGNYPVTGKHKAILYTARK
jgi:sugar phosphate permease